MKHAFFLLLYPFMFFVFAFGQQFMKWIFGYSNRWWAFPVYMLTMLTLVPTAIAGCIYIVTLAIL